ncbi:helix-turn-helix domain-containing protein [Dysgonomonas sp. OttesenSCG-928-M03]|nr:helix-turn-helix domain-containing protein [Dysgonomonas sp. OttesenSCG-928-M03]
MRDRIKAIMDAEDMTPARFADTLDIGRAVVSHILTGRNNPSLEVIMRILSKIPEINSEWLLTGSGNMYKDDKSQYASEIKSSNSFIPDLFSQIPSENSVNPGNGASETEYRKETIVNHPLNDTQDIVNERIIYKETPTKKIRQIIIYYTDSTFETFNHE